MEKFTTIRPCTLPGVIAAEWELQQAMYSSIACRACLLCIYWTKHFLRFFAFSLMSIGRPFLIMWCWQYLAVWIVKTKLDLQELHSIRNLNYVVPAAAQAQRPHFHIRTCRLASHEFPSRHPHKLTFARASTSR